MMIADPKSRSVSVLASSSYVSGDVSLKSFWIMVLIVLVGLGACLFVILGAIALGHTLHHSSF